jgi:hypothetical protein
MLVGLPLLGVSLAGRRIEPYLEFPPIAAPAQHAAFSWGIFLLIATVVVLCLAPFALRIFTTGAAVREDKRRHRGFPVWGWLGLALLAVAWLLAWTRFTWFAPFQPYTFSPIWLGYVLVVNALTYRRTDHCLLVDRPRYFLLLFAMSAVFWWFFEFLNRFVQNWHYLGAIELDPWPYFWQSTLPFSTVLPAVLSTREFLASFNRLSAGLANAWRIRVASPRAVAGIGLVAAGAALMCIGIWPELLYPLVWVAPLLVLTSLQRLSGMATLFTPLARGDWRDLWHVAMAALVCGLFWELWNYRSLAHWEYTIPYVHRFEVFHMPILGYAGYLPFGLECLAAARLLDGALGRTVR